MSASKARKKSGWPARAARGGTYGSVRWHDLYRPSEKPAQHLALQCLPVCACGGSGCQRLCRVSCICRRAPARCQQEELSVAGSKYQTTAAVLSVSTYMALENHSSCAQVEEDFIQRLSSKQTAKNTLSSCICSKTCGESATSTSTARLMAVVSRTAQSGSDSASRRFESSASNDIYEMR